MTALRLAALFPMAADLGHHWRTPPYEDCMSMDCDILEGRTSCFYDGSGLNAEPVMAALFTDGHDGVWRALDAYYASLVGESEPA